MTRNEQIKLIDLTFSVIEHTLSNQRMVNDFKRFTKQIRKEEIDHRKMFNPTDWNLTIAQAVRLDAVQSIIDYLRDGKLDPADFLNIRTSLFFAYAFVASRREELTSALAEFDLDTISRIRYSDLIL